MPDMLNGHVLKPGRGKNEPFRGFCREFQI
jgi:hypothetical protein